MQQKPAASVARVTREVQRFLADKCQEPGGIVVAVSGGPDSMALLRALHAEASSLTLPLIVAHLNHQLRGEESDADENLVRSLSAQLGESKHPPKVVCKALDVARLAREQGKNLEAVARDARYAWLAEVARCEGARWVATGHTASDQAETVLHRLLRGTGLQGLRGIASRRPIDGKHPSVDIIRPFLRLTRKDILDYLEELGQPYRTDSTNADTRLTRSRIRLELIPYLEQHFNTGVVAVLGRLAEQAEEAFQDESAEAEQLLTEAERPRAGPLLVFDRHRLKQASRRQVRNLFRLVWQREAWSVDAMSFAAWEQLADVAAGKILAVDVPGPIHVRRRGQVIQLHLKQLGAAD